MDVSPGALRAITFRERLRGYHPEDVDQFLERVAEGVAALQSKLDEALARADQAEQAGAAATDAEDAVRRTLMLAQRTADLALKEAKEEAARLVLEAQHTADKIAEDAQRNLRADIEKLETARKQLHDDVVAMQQYVEQERVRIRTALADLVRKVDSMSGRPPVAPVPTKIEVPPLRRLAPTTSTSRPAPTPAPPTPQTPPQPRQEPQSSPAAASTAASPMSTPSTTIPMPDDAPMPLRREPQPPPVDSPFAPARVAGPPSGPPPGPPPGPQRAASESAEDS
jgi:DivIVA domain-containing protein